MKKFKVGDCVKVVSNSHRPHHHFGIGIVADVREIDDDGTLVCQGKGKFGSTLSQYVSVEDVALVDKCQKIVVTTDGKTTTAKLFSGKELVKSAEAKCSPCDEFVFETGAALALDRLLDREAKAEPAFNKTDLAPGRFGRTGLGAWFVVANESLIYESGGFDRLDQVDPEGHLKYYGIDCIVTAYSFNHARDTIRGKVSGGRVIWSRPGAKFE